MFLINPVGHFTAADPLMTPLVVGVGTVSVRVPCPTGPIKRSSVDRTETHYCFGYDEAGARESGYQRGSRILMSTPSSSPQPKYFDILTYTPGPAHGGLRPAIRRVNALITLHLPERICIHETRWPPSGCGHRDTPDAYGSAMG